MTNRIRIILAIVFYLVIWIGVDALFPIPDFIVPPPMSIVRTLVSEAPTILRHCVVTLSEAFLGLAIGSGIGMVLSLLFLFWPSTEDLIAPGAIIIRSLPFVAVAPILILTLGGGMTPKVVVTAIVSFFPVMVNFSRGLCSAERDLVELFCVMNASKWQTFLKLRLPYSLPFLFKGIEVAASSAVVVAIVGEVLASDKGLGFLIVISKYNFQIRMLYAVMFVSSAASLLFVFAARALERISIPWENKSVE